MKIPLQRLEILLAAALLGASTAASHAQLPGDSTSGISAALTKLFGDSTSFTTKADVQVLDKSDKEWLRTPMNITVLDGKVRAEIDMMQAKSRDLPPAVLDSFKKMGMEHLISILRPDRKLKYIIFTGAKSYAEVPLSPEDIEASGKDLTIEKTPGGRETIDGHSCTKNRSVVKNSKGAILLDAITWNAADLKDFPVQIQTKEDGVTSIMRLQQIKFTKPDARQFELPGGYTKYESSSELAFEVSKKFLGGTTNRSNSPQAR